MVEGCQKKVTNGRRAIKELRKSNTNILGAFASCGANAVKSIIVEICGHSQAQLNIDMNTQAHDHAISN